MRALTDRAKLEQFMRRWGREVQTAARIYLTGGSSAVLLGWRESTIDIDLKAEPDADDILRALPRLKEDLSVNVELASPGDFIPELPNWRERSPSIKREGSLSFFHYDFYSQALSKIERSHARDVDDVMSMARASLITTARLLEMFEAIQPQLFRYPAIAPQSFRHAVEEMVRRIDSSE
jgi:uncharacterized nucleotidyltransferase DUF6036